MQQANSMTLAQAVSRLLSLVGRSASKAARESSSFPFTVRGEIEEIDFFAIPGRRCVFSDGQTSACVSANQAARGAKWVAQAEAALALATTEEIENCVQAALDVENEADSVSRSNV